MGVGTAVGLIVSGIISGVTAGVAAKKRREAMKKAEKKSLALAETQRSDMLAGRALSDEQFKKQMKQRAKEFRETMQFKIGEARKARRDRMSDKELAKANNLFAANQGLAQRLANIQGFNKRVR